MKSALKNTTFTQAPIIELRYAGFWQRFWASILDSIIFFIAAFLLIILTLVIEVMFQFSKHIDMSTYELLLNIIFTILYGCYHGFFLSSSWQATPGRKALGIFIIRQDGSKLSFLRAFFRCTLGYFISAIILYIGYIMAAFTSKKVALHDLIFNDYVVQKEEETLKI